MSLFVRTIHRSHHLYSLTCDASRQTVLLAGLLSVPAKCNLHKSSERGDVQVVWSNTGRHEVCWMFLIKQCQQKFLHCRVMRRGYDFDDNKFCDENNLFREDLSSSSNTAVHYKHVPISMFSIYGLVLFCSHCCGGEALRSLIQIFPSFSTSKPPSQFLCALVSGVALIVLLIEYLHKRCIGETSRPRITIRRA